MTDDTDTTSGPVAQLEERLPRKQVVVGSTPTGPSNYMTGYQARVRRESEFIIQAARLIYRIHA